MSTIAVLVPSSLPSLPSSGCAGSRFTSRLPLSSPSLQDVLDDVEELVGLARLLEHHVRARLARRGDAWPLTAMIGRSRVASCARRRRDSSSPSISGIAMSVTTTSGQLARHALERSSAGRGLGDGQTRIAQIFGIHLPRVPVVLNQEHMGRVFGSWDGTKANWRPLRRLSASGRSAARRRTTRSPHEQRPQLCLHGPKRRAPRGSPRAARR